MKRKPKDLLNYQGHTIIRDVEEGWSEYGGGRGGRNIT